MPNYTCRVSPWPEETHRNVLRTIHLNVSRLPCILAYPLPAPQSERGGKTGLSLNLVPVGPSWACPQRAQRSVLLMKGLENRAWTYPPSARAEEPAQTSTLPSPRRMGRDSGESIKNRPFCSMAISIFQSRCQCCDMAKSLLLSSAYMKGGLVPAPKET